MIQTTEDLLQLKGVGRVLAKRLYDAGFDSLQKIAQAGPEELKRVRGINERHLGQISQQARDLAGPETPEGPSRGEMLQQRLSGIKDQLQGVAESARMRFPQGLEKKIGKKLTQDLVRIQDVMDQVRGAGNKAAKRAGKALAKVEKRMMGLEDASLKRMHKGLKKARKTVLKALG
jgi:hypothetical protein